MKKNFNKLKRLLINAQKLDIKNFIIPVLEEAKLNTRTDEIRLVNGIKKLSKFLKKKSISF